MPYFEKKIPTLLASFSESSITCGFQEMVESTKTPDILCDGHA